MRHEENTPPEQQRSDRLDLWAQAMVLALLFTFLEVLKTHRTAMWSGATPREWRGVVVGLALYAVIVGMGAECVWSVMKRALGRRPPKPIIPVSAMLSAAGVWVILSVYREYAPTLDDALIGGALVGFAGSVMILPRIGILSLRGTCGLCGIVLLSAVAALPATNQYVLFHPKRADWVTIVPVVWAAMALAIGVVAWGFPNKPLSGIRRWGASLCIILLPLVFPALLRRTNHETPNQPAPNVILIVIDTLRADYCSSYGGHCAMPTMDALAKQGTLFERCYAIGPWTPPSMTGMLASIYPPGLTPGNNRSTWTDEMWRYAIRDEDIPLSECFAEAGYDTCALVANPLLCGLYGVLRGFNVKGYSHPMIKRKTGMLSQFPFMLDVLAAWLPSLVEERYTDTTADMTRSALTYLRQPKKKPFFLWLHYIDPHSPYDPPDEYRTMEGPMRAFAPIIDNMEWFNGAQNKKPLADYDPKLRPYVQSLYEGEIRYVDQAVGRVVRALEHLGLKENTIVCVTSDHGEELWDRGGWGHGQSLYDEQMRVPLVIAGPGVDARTVAEPVSGIDLAPTLAGLAGLTIPAVWQGKSLAPVVRGEAQVDAESTCFGRGTSMRIETEPLEMVVTGEHKLIRGARTGEAELYHLADDPAEVNDLVEQDPERTQQSLQALGEWGARSPSSFEAFLGGALEDTQHKGETLQQLQALGYM